MQVVKVSPRGYCYGVVDAVQMVRNAAKNPALPRPIYILGLIVHNRHVVDSLESEDIITLDGPDRLKLLETLDTGTVIFTAHGVSPEVKKRAIERGLTVIDATCPDVTRTHELVKKPPGCCRHTFERRGVYNYKSGAYYPGSVVYLFNQR